MAATIARLPALPTKSKFEEYGKDMDQALLKAVIQKYRAHIIAQRIRLLEIFQDFDPLRSGLMTRSRFNRCVTASMDKGIVSPLTSEECDILAQAFTVPKTDMVKYSQLLQNEH
jgi:hypothetical protein